MADELRFTAVEPNATVIFTKTGSPTAYSFIYRTDLNTTWQTYTLGTTLTIPSVGGWVEFKNGTETTSTTVGLSTSGTAYYHFTLNGPKVAASGNIANLLPYSNSVQPVRFKQYAFYALFDGCSSLTTPPELPDQSIALDQRCFSNLFYDCSSLEDASGLELPWQTLATYCYEYMFGNCTSLIQAPELPATTLVTGCYSAMFNGCTSLTTAPELPAATLASNCYSGMFNGCTRLNKMVYKGSRLSYTTNWLGGVSRTGTFYYTNQNLVIGSIQRTASGVPADWTIQYLAPKPSLVFSINGRAVASLTINGKAVAKLGA